MIKISGGWNFEQAATLSAGGLNALHLLRKAKIQKGEWVLLNGAGGSIGTYAIQVAKNMGAEVTVIDAGPKLETIQSIGADYIIDYREQDFSKDEKKYDNGRPNRNHSK